MAYSPARPATEAKSGRGRRRPDGRNLRAERTRLAVVDAMLELLDEGNVQPTAEQVSERAGVSERSLYQHFSDREQLFAAVTARQVERISKIARRLPTDGPLEQRLDAFIDQRVRVLELVSGVRRAALLIEPFSKVTAEGLALSRKLYKREVEKVFARELYGRSDRALLLASLAAATDWGAWESLRTHQGLSVARARASMHRTVGALLGCF